MTTDSQSYEMSTPTLIIGVGTEYRNDDAVGLIVARIIEDLAVPNVSVVEESGEGVALMHTWEQAERVILIDAVSTDAEPGTIFRIEANREPISSKLFRSSTHQFGPAEAVELSRALHELPASLIIYGIQGSRFDFGAEVSDVVRKAADQVVTRILQELTSSFLPSMTEL